MNIGHFHCFGLNDEHRNNVLLSIEKPVSVIKLAQMDFGKQFYWIILSLNKFWHKIRHYLILGQFGLVLWHFSKQEGKLSITKLGLQQLIGRQLVEWQLAVWQFIVWELVGFVIDLS